MIGVGAEHLERNGRAVRVSVDIPRVDTERFAEVDQVGHRRRRVVLIEINSFAAEPLRAVDEGLLVERMLIVHIVSRPEVGEEGLIDFGAVQRRLGHSCAALVEDHDVRPRGHLLQRGEIRSAPKPVSPGPPCT